MTIKQYLTNMGGAVAPIVQGDSRLSIYAEYAADIDTCLKYQFGARCIMYDDTLDIPAVMSMYLLSNLYKWTTLIKSTKFDYNPIDNYDGEEEEKITITHTGTDSDAYHDTIGKKETTQTRAPYNTSPLPVGGMEEGQQENDGNKTTTYDTTDTHVRELKKHGNMGVTSTQTMISQEREIANINIAHMIAQEIANTIAYSVYFDIPEKEKKV